MSKDEKNITLGKEGAVKLVCGIAVAAMVIIVAVVIIFVVRSNDGNNEEDVIEPNVPKRNVVTMDNVHEIVEQVAKEDNVAPGYYEITMNTTWDFADGASASKNAYVENSVSNTNDVYFDIVLAGTEETIYSSPVLPIGSYVKGITLDKQLDAGTYDCVVIYTLIDGEQNPLSNVQVALTIVVGS